MLKFEVGFFHLTLSYKHTYWCITALPPLGIYTVGVCLFFKKKKNSVINTFLPKAFFVLIGSLIIIIFWSKVWGYFKSLCVCVCISSHFPKSLYQFSLLLAMSELVFYASLASTGYYENPHQTLRLRPQT